MGTAQTQGALWGARAADWAEITEPGWRPVFDATLTLAGVRAGARLLDIGCGAGGALMLARERGAEVAGLDASENLVEFARARLPGAHIDVGEMEELPYGDEAFDIVIGINSFQFAGDLVRALSEARRVCRSGGAVFIIVWGRKEDCELITITMPAVFALLPTAAGGQPPIPLSQDGVIEDFMRRAGLSPVEAGGFSAELAFPDSIMAVRAVMSAAGRAIQHAGEDRVAEAVRNTLPRVTRTDGSVIWKNRFRWVRSIRPATG